MKKGYPVQIGKQTWKELEAVRNKGFSYFFNDWLDIILCSLLSLTENHSALCSTLEMSSISKGKYNDRYMKIIKKYTEGKPGVRAIDHLQRAFSYLMIETEESGKDVLGEIFQAQITYGEHGQFFTPEHITDVMAQMVGKDVGTKWVQDGKECKKEVMNDPCCGSGRFILSMAKSNPNCYFIGQDLDARCCKMTVLNMFMHDLEGEVRQGDSLAFKIDKRWIIKKGGFIYEDDQPRDVRPKAVAKPEQTKQESVLDSRTQLKEVQQTLW